MVLGVVRLTEVAGIKKVTCKSSSLVASLALLGDTEVVLGGECMHFPVCRIREMHGVASYRACIASGLNSCAPNGGYLLGKPRALELLLSKVHCRVTHRRPEGVASCGHTFVHYIPITNVAAASRVTSYRATVVATVIGMDIDLIWSLPEPAQERWLNRVVQLAFACHAMRRCSDFT